MRPRRAADPCGGGVLQRKQRLTTALLPLRPGSRLRADGEVVLDLENPRRRPCGAFGFPPFGPGAHAASEDHFATIRLDGDAAGVDLRATPECFLDLALDLARSDVRLQLDEVSHALDPTDSAHRVFCPFTLVIPLDVAFERDPAVLDDGADVLGA